MDFRDFKFDVKEVREDGTFSGIASKYGEEDLYGDVIDKGAFTKTISENPTIPILWQHDSREVIGSGTVKEWGNKISVDGKLDLEDPTAVKAYKKMKAALIRGLSIGFTTIKSRWEEVEGRSIRHISELKLWEVSVVTFPALPTAQVTRVKSADDTDAWRTGIEERIQALEATKSTPADHPTPEPPEVVESPPADESGWTHLAADVVQLIKG